MTWHVRPARISDSEIIVDYNARLAEESEGKSLDRDRLRVGVRKVLADPHKGRYFVATDSNGRVIGQTMITYEWSDWRNGWFWWIQSVYVEPQFRQKGVFRALFTAILECARDDPEVIGLRLYVEERNKAAQETYARLGLQPAGYFVLERYPLG